MGANSSSISELSSNDYLLRLAGNKSISPNDPFWNQLLSFSFSVPRTSADQRLLEEATALVCKNFSINNCQTGNFGSLVRVFLVRARELKASAQCEDNIFTWQTYNALFIIRNLCKYFVENLSEEVVVQQFETKTLDNKGEAEVRGPLTDELMSCLIEVLVDVPLIDFTYAIHLECLNTLLILLSMQMFQPSPAANSQMYAAIMQGRCSIHACLLMKTLLQNYIDQKPCPAALLKSGSGQHGMLYGVTAAVASGIWNVMTLGLANRNQEDPDEGMSDKLLANQSLLLILVLANHCTSESGLSNPYRQALFSFTDSQDQSSNSSPTQAFATFKIDLSKLYDTLSATLKEDQTTLLMYLLLHRNMAVKSFFLSRTNLDQLVIPILRILYAAQEKNSHHIYMALIILLILSEDSFFNKAVHETALKNVTWFKERSIAEISLGGVLILVVIRTIQYNMTRMRDKYLHTNCLAALANMSSLFKDLHPYAAQRIVSLFALLLKKHSRLVEQISEAAITQNTGQQSDDSDTETDYVEDLAVLEEVIRMVLEIINSCLCHQLHHNPNLVYTLLYQKETFAHFRTHPTFQDIIQNIDSVLNWFSSRLEKEDRNLSVQQVVDIIKQGAVQFKRDKLKKFPELKFKYVEEDQPEEFFIPYVWSLVYHSSNLYFNPVRIQLFSVNSPQT